MPISAQKSAIERTFLTRLDRKQFENFWHIEDLLTYHEAKYSLQGTRLCSSLRHYDTTITFSQDCRPIVRLPLDKTKTYIDPSNQELLPEI